jgi:hypothetical protein
VSERRYSVRPLDDYTEPRRISKASDPGLTGCDDPVEPLFPTIAAVRTSVASTGSRYA